MSGYFDVHNPELWVGLAFFAFLSSLPFVAAEWALGALQWPTPKGWGIVFSMATPTR